MTDRIRLLFISDNPAVRDLIADALRPEFAGLHVTGVHDPSALQHALASEPYDVAITDYQLEWAEGKSVLAQVKSRWPECPVVLFSVSGSDDLARDVAEARAAGPDAEPPHSIALLAGTVRAALERADLHRERRVSEVALRESEARFRSVFESATDAIVLADAKGTIVSWNRGAQAMFGYGVAEIVGKPLSVLMPERYRDPHQRGIKRHEETGEQHVIGRTLELHGLRKDGTEFPIELAIGAWPTDRGSNFSGIIRDITQRKRDEEGLRRSNEELRALSARVASIQEQERTTIAREIHDELGQSLTAFAIDIAWLRKRLAENADANASLLARLRSMSDGVDETIARVRRISAELRPQMLDELGLAAALEWQAQEFQSRTGIRCAVRAPIEKEPADHGICTGLFRIFQECLTNVARHSGARSAETSLRLEDGKVILEVRDDGWGIRADALASPSSLGLRGIHERARLLGGQVTISVGPHGGTLVSVSVPRPAAERARGSRRGAVA